LQKATAVPHVDIKDYKKQDDENFKKMGVVDHIEDGVARGVELAAKGLGAVLPNILGGGILSNLGKKAEEDRIQNEADYCQGEEAKAKKKALEARAEGGPVKPGQPYWVGENGPEIMKPDTAGSIIPNNQLQMPGTMDLSAMQNAMNPMSGASDIFKNISSKASQLWNGTESDKGKDTKAPSFDDMVNNFSKSIQEKVTNVTTNLTTSHMTAEQGKSLVAELQTLNKQTADMLKYIRDTADHAKNTVDATKALNGNLFAR